MPNQTFQDFDEYVDEIQDVDVEMMINGLVRSSWTIRSLETSAVQIQEGSQGSGDITAGQFSSEGYFLYLPLKNAAAQSANGVQLNNESVVIMEPGCEFYMNSKVDHGWCSIFVPTNAMPVPSKMSGVSQGKCRVVQTSAEASRQSRDLIVSLLNAAESNETLGSSRALEASFKELTNFSASLIDGRGKAEADTAGRPEIPRDEIFGRVMAAIEQAQNQPLLMADLLAACGVSERTLRSVFKERFGLSPSRYLQLRRLHQIRRALKAAEPRSTSVSNVLVEHGEWQFGRFAKRYRDAFGELPSETLRLP